MKVLLTDTLERIGVVGEVIDVSDGFARNYLLPKKLAIEPTEGNIERLQAARKEYEAKLKLLREGREKLLASLTGVEVTVARASNEDGHLFGSVSRRDLAEELQKQGFAVQPDDVQLDEPLRRIDTFTVPIQLAADLKTQIKVWVVRENAQGQVPSEGAQTAAAAGESTADATE
jgi:large subunit ribosomal protein L9